LNLGEIKTMSASSAELQRLLHLLLDTASKAEQEAYASGWRDCHAAMVKAIAGVADTPVAATASEPPAAETPVHVEPAPQAETPSWHSPVSYTNGVAAESSFAN
jgi:hypothetical protein